MEKAIDRAQETAAGGILTRDFGESVESFLACSLRVRGTDDWLKKHRMAEPEESSENRPIRDSGVATLNAKSGSRGNPIHAAALEATIDRVIGGSPSHFSRDAVVTAPLFSDLPEAVRA